MRLSLPLRTNIVGRGDRVSDVALENQGQKEPQMFAVVERGHELVEQREPPVFGDVEAGGHKYAQYTRQGQVVVLLWTNLQADSAAWGAWFSALDMHGGAVVGKSPVEEIPRLGRRFQDTDRSFVETFQSVAQQSGIVIVRVVRPAHQFHSEGANPQEQFLQDQEGQDI
ncbi:unnamed protein product, partial [Nesidiocoris tenuis]